MKWFNWMEIFAVGCFIVWTINMSMTDYTAGILQYSGFIPQGWDMLLLILFVFLSFIWIGATIESEIDRSKLNLKGEKDVK